METGGFTCRLMSSDVADAAWKKRKKWGFRWVGLTLGMYVGGRRYIVGEVYVCVCETLL